MAGANKRSKKVEKADSDEEYQSDESGTYHGQQEIQATFEGRNPESYDFHGIKQLLQQLFLTVHIDLSQISDMIISQTGIGSVLKQSCNDSDDEEDVEMVQESDVFGITSIINLSSHKETPCVKQFYEFLEEEGKNQTEFRQKLSDSHRLGFIINERFVNIPSKISSLMLNSLHDEITRMKKKDSSYDFDYFVMISKIWKGKSDQDDIFYSNDEEHLFVKKAVCTFDYSVAGKTDTGLTGKWQSDDQELIPFRRVILFKADKLPSILGEIDHFVQT